ncbi:MAG: hypothetical protein R2741_09965 [Methanolobus sp.]
MSDLAKHCRDCKKHGRGKHIKPLVDIPMMAGIASNMLGRQ